MAKEKMIRLSKIKENLSFHDVDMDYPKIAEWININYPYVKLSDKPHLSSVPERIAQEIIKDIARPIKPTKDAREHIYLLLPTDGVYIVPRNLKDKNDREIMNLGATKYGTTDLSEYANRLKGETTIHDLAEYLKKHHRAKEITYEEFESRAKSGKPPEEKFIKIPIDIKRTDEWEDEHLEVLAEREKVDTSTIETIESNKGG